MRTGFYRFCILASGGIGLLMACSNPDVDLGKATGATYEDPCPTDAGIGFDGNMADAPWLPDAPDILDASPDVSWPPIDASTPDSWVPPTGDSLFVDGMACSTIDTDGQTREWPHWAITVEAHCPTLGYVRVRVDSYANIAYPQTCSVATTVQLHLPWGGVVPDAGDAGWGGTSLFEAGYSDGHCTVASGPTMVAPARGLELSALVEDVYGSGLTHFVYYRADDAP